MRLAIVSHTPHHEADGPQRGALKGWGASVREIDRLATLFESVVHVAPVHPGAPPGNSRAYRATNVTVMPVRPAGGPGIGDKLGILAAAPGYLRTLRRALREADVVHVRLPSNIGAVALLLLSISSHPTARWYKYAGNWRPRTAEPISYRVQRWLLSRRVGGGVVSVNGEWPCQPTHVVPFPNPSLSDRELAEAAATAAGKLAERPAKLLFVGRLESRKGLEETLATWNLLREACPELELDVVGDGPGRDRIETVAQTSPDRVRLHGWLSRERLDDLYRRAHILLHPSHTEGWPKVLGEAMAFGVVPVASAVSCIPQVLSRGPAGTTLPAGEPAAFADAIRAYVDDSERWRRHSAAARRLAGEFTYERYLDRLQALFCDTWKIELSGAGPQ